MNNLGNEKKQLKRYLKTKINLSEATIVKYLITGAIGLSLTACGGSGGGGGGGNSSDGGVVIPPVTETVKIDKKNESYIVNGKNITITGNISGDIVGLKGIDATNSNITNSATIILSGDNSIGIYGTQDKILQGKEYTITNKGTISISGKNSVAMQVENGVVGVNEGIITGTGEGKFLKNEDGTFIENTLGSIGILAKDGSKAINNKDINLDGAYTIGMKGINKSVLENNGNITMNSKLVDENEWIHGISPEFSTIKTYSRENGMVLSNESKGINSGLITGVGNIVGIKAENNSEGINKGKIITSSKAYNSDNNLDNRLQWVETIGMDAIDSKIINDVTGTIEMKNNGLGMNGVNSVLINNGKIIINGDESIINSNDLAENAGMFLDKNSKGENNGSIIITGNNSETEAIVLDNTSSFVNNGKIEIENKGLHAIGITGSGGEKLINNGSIKVSFKQIDFGGIAEGISTRRDVLNTGNITVKTTGGSARGISSRRREGSTQTEIINDKTGKITVSGENNVIGIYSNTGNITNNGEITIKGNTLDSNGVMIVGDNGIATNNDTINVDGNGSIGMHATEGATAINSEKGIINVSATAGGGMLADGIGSKVINKGTINIDKDNLGLGTLENGVEITALKTINGGTIENYGAINTGGDVNIGAFNEGNYVIGSTKDGSYGKLTAKNVTLNGTVKVDATITTNGFKSEYIMQNVVDAENILIGDKFEFNSSSLLYDAESKVDTWGNLDATLKRNNKTLSDFVENSLVSSADIFGKYQTAKEFSKLDNDAKEVIGLINTDTKININNSLKQLTPTIYGNLGRQMLEIADLFQNQEMTTINSLGDNSFNFTFFGNYSDTSQRNYIEGYTSKISGFVGTANLGNEIYGSLGYGYNKIDYTGDSKGNIQSIHLGLQKLSKLDLFDLKLGILGEYNFHETTRDLSLFNRNAKSDFNSYGLRVTSEISKTFNEYIDIKPYLSLDISHNKYDTFKETGANSINAKISSESYTVVTPKIGLDLSENFGGLNLYTGIDYSYDLGNLGKTQSFSYEGFEGKGILPTDTLKSGNVSMKIGSKYTIKNFNLEANVGKSFGKRDNLFTTLSLGYSF